MRLILPLFGLLLISGCGGIGGCASGAPGTRGTAKEGTVLTAKDADKPSTVAVGSTLAIEVKGRPSTGYDWQYGGGGEPYLVSLGDPEFKLLGPEENVEQGGMYRFRFRADRPGQCTLLLRYARPWEKNGDADVLRFPVRVTP